jgi:hypothetical protein
VFSDRSPCSERILFKPSSSSSAKGSSKLDFEADLDVDLAKKRSNPISTLTGALLNVQVHPTMDLSQNQTA